MVTGLVINSKELPDPICEPCLAGKMNANPFPSSQNHTTVPLHHIHSDLHERGCTAYVHVQKDKRTGIGAHVEKSIFIGYPTGWKFWNPTTQRVVISERAEFDECSFPTNNCSSTELTPTHSGPSVNSIPSAPVLNDKQDKFPIWLSKPTAQESLPMPPSLPSTPSVKSEPFVSHNSSPEPSPAPLTSSPAVSSPTVRWWNPPADPVHIPLAQPAPTEPEPTLRHGTRVRNHPGQYWVVGHEQDPVEDARFVELANAVEAGTQTVMPRSYKHAMSTANSKERHDAAQVEMDHHKHNGTWKIVKAPADSKAIASVWVFDIKRNSDGSIERHKGRLVAKGFAQPPGFDYNETFAPTFRRSSLCIITVLAAQHDLHMRSVDITAAFTHGSLDETIYMCQPEGFHVGDQDDVCILDKALYGLKQTARQWNLKLHAALLEMGFQCLESDRSIYLYVRGEVRIIIPVYVDDITFVSKVEFALDEVVLELFKYFKLRDLGPTRFLLGIQIERDWEKRSISLSQCQYIVDKLEQFGMANCNSVTTPMQPSTVLSSDMCPKTSEAALAVDKERYGSALGALLYLATSTRPDISYAVGEDGVVFAVDEIGICGECVNEKR
jgi:hypothetical protein